MLLRNQSLAILSGAVFACLLCSRLAGAQDLAAAQVLFDKGRAAMIAKDFDIACPALRESQRIDPRPGTLFTVAECEADAGLYASAVAHYEDYLEVFGRMDQQEQLKQEARGRKTRSTAQKERIGPLVPFLTVVLSRNVPSGTRVRRDDLELTSASFGVALPVDPGTHVLTVTPPDQASFEIKVTLKESEKKTVIVEMPVAPPAPSVTAGASTSTVFTGTTPSTSASASATAGGVVGPSSTWSMAKTGALVAGGAGFVGLVVGAVTGVVVVGYKGVIDAHCTAAFKCDPDGLAAAESSKAMGLGSTIGFGIGLGGLAAAALLWGVAPSPPKLGAAPPKVTLSFDVVPQGHDKVGAFAVVQGSW